MKLFISYSRDDAGDFARHIHRYLRDKGHDVFIDVSNIRIGDPWAGSIEKNISECDIFVVILTPDSITSSHVEQEVLQAQKENKIIVPCINEDVEYSEIKWGLERVQGIEFSDEYKLTRKLYSKIKITKPETKTDVKTDKYSPIIGQQNLREPEPSHLFLKKAKGLEEIGQYTKALKAYDEAIKINPNNFEIFYSKGLLHYKIGDFENARKVLDKATDIDWKHKDVWYHLGAVLEKLEKYDEALNAFNTDLRIDDKDIRTWTSKATLLEKQKNYKEAIQCYDKILDINSRDAYTLYNKARNFHMQRNYQEAIIWYDRALENDPKLFRAFYNKGLIYNEQGKYKEAIDYHNKALEIDPAYVNALNGKGKALQNLGNYKEAIECCDKALQIDPNNADINQNKLEATKALKNQEFTSLIDEIKSQIQDKNYSKVIELFKEIEDPVNDSILQKYKGDALYNIGNYEQALQCYENALRMDSQNIDIQYQKANTLEKLANYDEALKLFDELLKVQPNNLEILNKCGQISHTIKRYDAAIQYYDKILAINSKNLDVLKGKALVSLELKKYVDAIKYYNKALELDPNNKDLIKYKEIAVNEAKKQKYSSIIEEIKLHYTNKDYPKVFSLSKQAIDLQPHNPTSYKYKGLALYNSSKYREAIICYDKILDIEPGNTDAINKRNEIQKQLTKIIDTVNNKSTTLQVTIPKYSCFISYAHTNSKLMEKLLMQLKSILADHLGLFLRKDIYFDIDRMEPGYSYNEKVTQAICESACMIVVYTPQYEELPYCLYEFLVMEKVEEKRKQLLGNKYDQSYRMIIPIILGGKLEDLPEKIKCLNYYDISKSAIVNKGLNNQKYHQMFSDIANYIYTVFLELKELDSVYYPGHPGDSFILPSKEEAIKSWNKTKSQESTEFPRSRAE